MTNPKCPYCHANAALVKGLTLYPRFLSTLVEDSLNKQYFWVCPHECDAYVGCYDGTQRPKGTLANRELRRERAITYNSLKAIWEKGFKAQQETYAWIREELGLSKIACHIGKFDMDLCKAVQEVVKQYMAAKHLEAAINIGDEK